MKLYTKGGDDGTTGLIGNVRVSKSDLRVAAYGEVDETNAAIGVAAAACADKETVSILRELQSDLFELGAQLATPPSATTQNAAHTAQVVASAPAAGAPAAGDTPRGGRREVGATEIERLERLIDQACGQVPPLKQFILPGGTSTAAALHLARTICRRAERAVVGLAEHEPQASAGAVLPSAEHEPEASISAVSPCAVIYLNRLSDLLFALARLANHRAGMADLLWPVPKPL